jgi:hypothetical protein
LPYFASVAERVGLTMDLIKRQRLIGDRKGRSRVSLAREVNIGLDEQAPRGELPSLDFDRVVNSYSIEATKKRLLAHHRLFNKNAPEDYRAFSEETFQAASQHEVNGTRSCWKNACDNGHHNHQALLRMPYGKQVMTWVLTLLTGMITGLVAIFILFCVEKIVKFRTDSLNRSIRYVYGTVTEDDEHDIGDRFFRSYGIWGVYIQLTIFNMGMALLSSAMCVYLAPSAVGSGIPEVKAYLNGVRVPSFAFMNTFLTTIIGTILSVSSGLVVGPEGESVIISSSEIRVERWFSDPRRREF